jgi:ABC-type uncharacterized transport system involved in gliding motility auxiliary subunit
MAAGLNAYSPLVRHVTDKTEIQSEKRLISLFKLVLLISFAIVLAWAGTRFSTEFDWTREGRHTLSEASIKILNQLDGPIQITAYARESFELRNAIGRYIGKYQSIKADISLSFVNPDSVPDRVRELGIRINGELIFEYQGRTENVRAADENSIINALVRLSRSSEQWLAFITGHGERNFLGTANHDLGEFGNYLSKRGYKIQPLNLAEVRTVPDNTSILALTGPQIPLLAGEISLLVEYLQRGGNFLWLLDPDEKNLPQQLVNFFEFDVANGTVIDIAGQLVGIKDPTFTMITSSLYGAHPATKDFEFTTLFPKAAVLLPKDSETWSTVPLLMTGTQTWLETSTLDGEVEFESDTDLQGPLSIGLALSRPLDDTEGKPEAREQRVIIIGDGDFISNTYLSNAGNLDLGMRIINWLGDEDNLIEIPARSATDTQLTISSVILGGLGILFLVVLPLLFISTGIFIWWKRRQN